MLLLAASILFVVPGEVKAETRPGGTLKNDQPARTYTTGWWWTDTPDDLQFKVPTKTNEYTAIAIQNRAAGEDFDLFAYNDYSMSQEIASSTKGSDVIDFVVIDGHTYTGNYKYAKVYKFTGSNWNSGIRIESDYHTVSSDLYGNDPDADGDLEIGKARYSLFEYHGTSTYSGTLRGEYPIVNMYDVYLESGGEYDFDIYSVYSSQRLSTYLFKGSGNSDDALAYDKASVNGESLSFSYDPEVTGYYGLCVIDENLGYDGSFPYDNQTILISSDFEMSADPVSHLIAPGMNASYEIDIDSLGITGDIDLHYRWNSGSSNISTPSGASGGLNVNKVTPGGVGTKKVYLNVSTTSSMSAGTYYLDIYGNDTGLNGNSHDVRVKLVISTSPDFFLTTTPELRVISPSTTTTYQVEMDTINNFNSDVTLYASSDPSSSTLNFSFSPSQINASSSVSNLTVTTTTSTPVDIYNLTIWGTGGTLTRYGNSTLRIKEPITIDLVSPGPSDLVSGVYTFQAKAGDPTGTKSVKISFGGQMSGLGSVNMYYNSANSFWERTVNTYSYIDGSCSLNVTAEDYGSGVTTLGPINFTLSNSAPNPIINTPLDRSYVTGTSMPISVNTTSHVITCRFKVDQNAWTPLTRSGNTWTGTWDTTQITDGQHTLTIDAKDTAGLTGETSVTIFVDNSDPTCDINSPIDGQFIDGSYTFRVVSTDTVGVHHVDLTVFGQTTTLPYNPITSSYEYTISTTTKTDGTYTAYATSYDNVNLSENSDTITFYIDNNDPTLSINSPETSEIIGGTYNVSVTSSDLFLQKIEYRVDSGGWQNLSGSDPDWWIHLNTTELQDGTHTLSVRSQDMASHLTEQAVQFIVDNTRPTCNLVSPFEGRFIEGVFTFQVSSTDSVGIDRVVLDMFSDSVQTTLNKQTGYYEYQFNTLTVTDGTYNVTATSYDLSGKNRSSSTVSFRVDNLAPELAVVGLQTGDYVSGIISFSVNVSDAFLKDVMYSIDGGEWVNTTQAWNTSQILDGSHQVILRARDMAGHTTTQTLNLIVDNNVPVCSVNSPVADEYIEGSYTFRLSASDSVGIDKVYLHLFGSNFTATFSGSSGYYEFTTDTSIRTDGNYSCRAITYDLSGKMTESSWVSFKIDNDAPQMVVNEIQTGDYVSGNISFNVSATDRFLQDVGYSVDGGAWVSISTTWITGDLLDGSHTVIFRARDQGGHATTQSMNLIVDNNAPVCSVNSPVEDEYIETAYTFRLSATDSVGIDRVYLNLFGANFTATYSGASGYYEFTTDTSLRSDGNYSCTAITYDLSGKMTESSPINFKIDNNDPQMTVNGLQTGDYISGNISFNVSASDRFLLDVTYSVDGGAWIQIGNPWITGNLLDGSHSVVFRSRDKAGHDTKQTMSLIVDNTYPVVTVNSPATDEFVDDAYTFRVSALDAVGMDRVYINVFGNNYLATFSSSSGYWEFTTDTTLKTDGNYNCTATGYDLSGKETVSSEVSFKIDNNAPVLRVVNPLPGDFLDGYVVIAVNTTDTFLNRTEYNVDGTGWVDVSVPLNTSNFGDGNHMITIRSLDDAGHVTTTSVNVIIDNFSPVGTISYPGENAYVTELTPTFRVVASDIVGVEGVMIGLDFPGLTGDLSMSYNSATGYYEFRTDVTLIPDGDYNITVTITDLSGKELVIGPVLFNVDTHSPEIVLNELGNGKILSGETPINMFARDVYLNRVTYRIDENEPIQLSYEMTGDWANASFLLDTRSFNDGGHTVTFNAYDKAGWYSSVTFDIFMDNIAPTCTITSPVSNEFVEGVITIRVTAFDIVGIDYVRIQVYDLDAQVPFNAQTGYYEYSSNTITWGAGEDGVRNVTAIAYDLTGKSYTYGPVSFNVDNRAPTININSPKEGEIVSGTYFFDVINSDVFKKGTDYNIDGASWQPVSIGWNTELVTDGPHEVTIRATDLAGHVTTESMMVIVDNNDPEISGAGPTENEFIEGSYIFRIAASDGVGIDQVKINIAGMEKRMSLNSLSGYYEYMLDTKTLPDGTYKTNASVTDLSGKTVTTETVDFNIDNNAPDLVVEAPVKDQLISGLFVVRAYTEDVFPGAVYYAIDGTTWIEVTKPWNSTKVIDGKHRITIMTEDEADHRTDFDIEVVVDNTAPIISQATIVPGQSFSGVQTLRFYAYDSIGIRQVQLSIDERAPFEIYRGEGGLYYEYLFDTRTVKDGDHLIKVECLDRAGNTMASSYGIKVDNTGPEIDMDYYWIVGDQQINEGEVKEGKSVVFEATVEDPSGVETVMINIDSQGWREMTPDANSSNPDTFVLFWPTSGVEGGSHVFQIRTTDKLGNERVMSGMLNVKEYEEKNTFIESFTEYLPLIWLILFILLVILIFVLAYTGVITKWAKGEGMKKNQEPDVESKEGGLPRSKTDEPKKESDKKLIRNPFKKKEKSSEEMNWEDEGSK